jgi:hypothetical protein
VLVLRLGDFQAAMHVDQVSKAELAGEAVRTPEGLGSERRQVIDVPRLTITEAAAAVAGLAGRCRRTAARAYEEPLRRWRARTALASSDTRKASTAARISGTSLRVGAAMIS